MMKMNSQIQVELLLFEDPGTWEKKQRRMKLREAQISISVAQEIIAPTLPIGIRKNR